jgi:prophage DNA circulation protein
VKLGLDPKQFTKGQKEAAAAVAETEAKVKQSSERTGNDLTKMAAKWLTVAAAIKAVQFAVKTIDDVAKRTRQLGIDARNYGLAARKMRNFENAVEAVGGSADDARGTLQRRSARNARLLIGRIGQRVFIHGTAL